MSSRGIKDEPVCPTLSTTQARNLIALAKKAAETGENHVVRKSWASTVKRLQEALEATRRLRAQKIADARFDDKAARKHAGILTRDQAAAVERALAERGE